MNTQQLEQLILSILEDMKAVDLVNLDVSQLTDVTDKMIICSGTSNRHTQAMADRVVAEAKAAGFMPLGVEGLEQGDWVLVDFSDIVLHLMQPETRSFYSLEKLWTVVTETRGENEN